MFEEFEHSNELLDSSEGQLSEPTDISLDLRLRLITLTAELGEKEAD